MSYTRFRILHDPMAAFLIKSGDQPAVSFPYRNLNLVSIMEWILHPNDRMYRYTFQMCYFFHHALHLILFHFQLQTVTHMLQAATVTIAVTDGVYALRTPFRQFQYLTESKILFHLYHLNRSLFIRERIWYK